MSWILITLLAISFTGNYPLWALGIAVWGGLGLGAYFWHEVNRRQTSSEPTFGSGNFLSLLCKYELFLQIPFLLILLLANRLPVHFSFFALAILLLLGINRKIATGKFTVLIPLSLPVLLLLIPSLVSLYAAVDLRQSWNAICMLIAGMALFLGLTHNLNSEPRLLKTFGYFLVAGAGIAASIFLIMKLPGSKMPFISSFYSLLPNLLPRKIHPNYLGGSLTFFFPMTLWALIGGYKKRIWIGIAVGLLSLGLLMTQSRGALLGTGVAVILMGAYGIRWVRYGLPLLVIIAGLLVYSLGVEGLLDPAVGDGVERKLENRQELWERAVYISQDFAFTGTGLRSFPVVVDLLYPLFLIGPNARMPHPHNLYLDVVASIGFPGFVAFWTLLGAWGGMVWEILRRCWGNSKLRYCEVFGVGLAGGMVAHLVYSVTDAIALGEKAGVIFWAVLGLTAALWRLVRTEGTS